MSLFLATSVVISAVLVGGVYAVRAGALPRVRFRGGAQRIGATRIFDGGVEVGARDDQGACLSGYICYIRRAREKDGLPTVIP